jgi:SAM-dependent methyltransferase
LDLRYWERIAGRYEEEVFSSAGADLAGVVARHLDALADPRAVAIDFGCGVGHYLPLLAERFREVHGLDFAAPLVEQARERCLGLAAVRVQQADLSKGRAPRGLPRARVAVCANVLISQDERMRRGILRAIARQLVAGGHLLLVVPSLESALFANQRLIEWNRRLGFDERESIDSGIAPSARSLREIVMGLVRIDGVPTKHYLREEALVLLDDAGFTVRTWEKVEYGWETEFEKPPRFMKRPGPWDWLFVARRRRNRT